MILHYFIKKENKQKKVAQQIYKNILSTSNALIHQNTFFKVKNYNSSFELVSFILIIYINSHIKNKVDNYKLLNEELIKLFITDLDDSLRNNGIGDMSIGKYVKSYVKKFYFRLKNFPSESNNVKLESFTNYLSKFDFIRDEELTTASETFFELATNIYNNNK
tara:strand:- start:277 stop:765 length:489 start_codon:yes stop_codon:yes gene_type:complete